LFHFVSQLRVQNGEFFRRKTLPFNGYGAQVAQLYKGMDLQKNF